MTFGCPPPPGAPGDAAVSGRQAQRRLGVLTGTPGLGRESEHMRQNAAPVRDTQTLAGVHVHVHGPTLTRVSV